MAYLGETIKKLGFGLMRLPQKDGAIDIEQTKEMVDLFLGAGFTYFDTAWAYAGSEDAIRRALVERYPRDSYQLATKNAAWINCKTREEATAQLDTSRSRRVPGILTFICCTIWGKAVPGISTILICGAGFRKRSRRGWSSTSDSLSTRHRKSWRKS